MRFPFPRKPSEPSPEATAAVKRAEAALERARRETPKLRAIAESLREVQRRNHLAEAFEHALRGHHQ